MRYSFVNVFFVSVYRVPCKCTVVYISGVHFGYLKVEAFHIHVYVYIYIHIYFSMSAMLYIALICMGPVMGS